MHGKVTCGESGNAGTNDEPRSVAQPIKANTPPLGNWGREFVVWWRLFGRSGDYWGDARHCIAWSGAVWQTHCRTGGGRSLLVMAWLKRVRSGMARRGLFLHTRAGRGAVF